MQALIIFMSFLDFMFFPLIIATIIVIIIEQIIRRVGSEDNYDDQRWVNRAMGVRKFFYRQAWIVNILWFLGYIILMFTVGRQSPQMPDMIWQG